MRWPFWGFIMALVFTGTLFIAFLFAHPWFMASGVLTAFFDGISLLSGQVNIPSFYGTGFHTHR
jgi:hypothetical protein